MKRTAGQNDDNPAPFKRPTQDDLNEFFAPRTKESLDYIKEEQNRFLDIPVGAAKERADLFHTAKFRHKAIFVKWASDVVKWMENTYRIPYYRPENVCSCQSDGGSEFVSITKPSSISLSHVRGTGSNVVRGVRMRDQGMCPPQSKFYQACVVTCPEMLDFFCTNSKSVRFSHHFTVHWNENNVDNGLNAYILWYVSLANGHARSRNSGAVIWIPYEWFMWICRNREGTKLALYDTTSKFSELPGELKRVIIQMVRDPENDTNTDNHVSERRNRGYGVPIVL